MRNTLFGLAAFIAAILGLLVASIVIPRPMTDEQKRELGLYHFDKPRPIAEFNMTVHRGKAVGLASLQGQWSLVFFGFTTCPDICPTTLGVLSRAVRDLEEAPQVIMVTVDPERDTPELLSQYVPAFNPAFVGYTGSFDETVALAQQVNIAFGKMPGDGPGTYTMDHTASLVVIDPQGRYAGFIKAPHNAQNIKKIIRALI